MKYDCVSELNPIIGERPTIPRMIATKTILLAPAIERDYTNDQLTQKSIRSVNGFMAFVVGNNYNVLQRAQKYCNKI